jgi:hypothetical protein
MIESPRSRDRAAQRPGGAGGGGPAGGGGTAPEGGAGGFGTHAH